MISSIYLHGLQEALVMRQIDGYGAWGNDDSRGGSPFPYSPFFNPIEKHQKPRNYEELTLAMNNVRNVITAENCNNYITRTNRNFQTCIKGQDFFDNLMASILISQFLENMNQFFPSHADCVQELLLDFLV